MDRLPDHVCAGLLQPLFEHFLVGKLLDWVFRTENFDVEVLLVFV